MKVLCDLQNTTHREASRLVIEACKAGYVFGNWDEHRQVFRRHTFECLNAHNASELVTVEATGNLPPRVTISYL